MLYASVATHFRTVSSLFTHALVYTLISIAVVPCYIEDKVSCSTREFTLDTVVRFCLAYILLLELTTIWRAYTARGVLTQKQSITRGLLPVLYIPITSRLYILFVSRGVLLPCSSNEEVYESAYGRGGGMTEPLSSYVELLWGTARHTIFSPLHSAAIPNCALCASRET